MDGKQLQINVILDLIYLKVMVRPAKVKTNSFRNQTFNPQVPAEFSSVFIEIDADSMES